MLFKITHKTSIKIALSLCIAVLIKAQETTHKYSEYPTSVPTSKPILQEPSTSSSCFLNCDVVIYSAIISTAVIASLALIVATLRIRRQWMEDEHSSHASEASNSNLELPISVVAPDRHITERLSLFPRHSLDSDLASESSMPEATEVRMVSQPVGAAPMALARIRSQSKDSLTSEYDADYPESDLERGKRFA